MNFEPTERLDMSSPERKRQAYALLGRQWQALLAGESDPLANLAQLSALVFHSVPDLNWAGFYLLRGDTLVLGPFQGKVACTRIPVGRGVCGACAASRQVQIVPDVHAVADHIACDSASNAELVLPLLADGRLLGVFDLDSPLHGRFDTIDAQGMGALLEALVEALVGGSDWQAGTAFG